MRAATELGPRLGLEQRERRRSVDSLFVCLLLACLAGYCVVEQGMGYRKELEERG